jgi:copper chaperone CopZ
MQDIFKEKRGGVKGNMSHYVHSIPGRLRVRTPKLKHSTIQAKKVEAVLHDFGGVDDVSVNVVTGSIVILYDPDLVQAEAILKKLQDHRYLDESRRVSGNGRVEKAAYKAATSITRILFGWAVGKAFEGSSLSFISVLI